MKKIAIILILFAEVAVAQDFRKNEFGTFAGIYSSGELPNTVAYGQQYTRWLNKNIGVSVGTFRTDQEVLPTNDSPLEKAKTRQEAHRYWDFSLQSRANFNKIFVGAAAGVSSDKFYQTRFFDNTPDGSRFPRFDAETTIDKKALAHLEATIGYRFSPAVSVSGYVKSYLGSENAAFYGARLSYHFDVNRDSLGVSPNNKIDFGVVGGGGLVGALGSNPNGYRVLLPYAGVYFQRELSVAWDARIEVLYARRGFSARRIEAGKITYNSQKLRADFIQIPILFENEFMPNWNLYFGPHFSFLLNSNYEVGGEKEDISEGNGLTFGLTAGLSRNLTERLSLETRYALDFLSFTPYTYANTLNDFRLGLKFRVN